MEGAVLQRQRRPRSSETISNQSWPEYRLDAFRMMPGPSQTSVWSPLERIRGRQTGGIDRKGHMTCRVADQPGRPPNEFFSLSPQQVRAVGVDAEPSVLLTDHERFPPTDVVVHGLDDVSGLVQSRHGSLRIPGDRLGLVRRLIGRVLNDLLVQLRGNVTSGRETVGSSRRTMSGSNCGSDTWAWSGDEGVGGCALAGATDSSPIRTRGAAMKPG